MVIRDYYSIVDWMTKLSIVLVLVIDSFHHPTDQSDIFDYDNEDDISMRYPYSALK